MDGWEGWVFLRSDGHGGPWRLPGCAVTERAGDRNIAPLLVRGTGWVESSVRALKACSAGINNIRAKQQSALRHTQSQGIRAF